MFGWCDLGMGPGCSELGYVSLQEIESLRGALGLKVETDQHYNQQKLKELMDG